MPLIMFTNKMYKSVKWGTDTRKYEVKKLTQIWWQMVQKLGNLT